MAILILIRTEYAAPDVIPFQCGIGRIAQLFPGYGEIVEILQVSLYRLPHEIGAASIEFPGGGIQRFHQGLRQSDPLLVFPRSFFQKSFDVECRR